MSRITSSMRPASPSRMKAPPFAPFCSRTMPAISRLRSASRSALRPTPSCCASSRSAGSLSPGFRLPAAIWARMRSQISSKARRTWIGWKLGGARSTALASAPAAPTRSGLRGSDFISGLSERMVLPLIESAKRTFSIQGLMQASPSATPRTRPDELHRRAAGVPRQHPPHGRAPCRADRRRDRRDRPLPDRTAADLRRHGADAAVGARALRRPRGQPDDDVHRPRGDLARLAGLRLDRRPQHDVHHAAAAFRHRGAAPALPAEDRQGRRRHRDRDLGAAGRLRRQRDDDPRGARRRQLRHQRPQAVVQLRRRGRVHRADGAHRGRPRRFGASARSCSSRRR